jgi:hypothetical protein
MNKKDVEEREHCFTCHEHLGGAGFVGDNIVVVVVVVALVVRLNMSFVLLSANSKNLRVILTLA